MSKPEDFKFDSRVRDRLLRNRVLSSADVQRHLEQLPDLEGEYEVLSDTPQPAVAPPRSEVHEEPLVFDGIRRLQALGEVSAPPPARFPPPASPPASSSGLPAYREPEPRGLGTPLRSALMESEISGVGAGAVSAALGAMAAEARGASMFGSPPVTVPQVAPSEPEPGTPVTLRSEPTPPAVAEVSPPAVAEPSPPAAAEPSPPAVAEVSPPAVAEVSPPAVAEPSPPAAAEVSPPAVAEASPAPAFESGSSAGEARADTSEPASDAAAPSNAVADEEEDEDEEDDEDDETSGDEDEDEVDDSDEDDSDEDDDDDDDSVDAAGSDASKPDNEELA